MKNAIEKGLMLLTAALLLYACTPAYRLESGSYQLSLQDVPGLEAATQTVLVETGAGLVSIRHPSREKVMTGVLKGNQLTITAEESGAKVEFKGRLTADNRVEGQAVQQSADKTVKTAKFRMQPQP